MPSAAASGNSALRFGVFEFDVETGELRKSGHRIALRPQAARVLATLAMRRGQLVTREQLKGEIWGYDTFVDFENALNSCIRQIRAALNDDADTPRYVETLPRRGYRFIAPVEELISAPAALPQSEPSINLAVAQPLRSRRISRGRPWLVGVLAFTLIAAGVVLFNFSKIRDWGGKEQPLRIQSLAVLPLENLSRDPDQEYFADGMTDELITALAAIHSIKVISRNSVIQYKGKHRSVPQISQDLRVDALVEGTVMRSGDRVRITAQLIAAPQDRHLWAKAYEGDLHDVLSLQDEVARDIAAEIRLTLTPPEQSRLSKNATLDTGAYEAYLRGLHELHGMTAEPTEALQSESIQKAIVYFQEALAHDPKNAAAYAGLADAYSNLSTEYRAPLEVMPKSKAAAQRAVELDDTLAEAHASLGYVALTFDWDWPAAEREFRRALELNPNSPRAHAGYAEYLLFIGRNSQQAMEEMQAAYSLDPLLPQAHGDRAWFLFLSRRYAEAIDAAHSLGHGDSALALSYAELGRHEEAIAAADRVVQVIRAPVPRAQIAAAYAIAKRQDKARAMIAGIEAQARDRYVCGFNVAGVYSALGDKEQAFAWLERAYRDRSD